MAGGLGLGLARRFKEVTSKYGRVAVGVHLSISALCFTGCYVAVRSSLHVERVLESLGLLKEPAQGAEPLPEGPPGGPGPGPLAEGDSQNAAESMARGAVGAGGALALAFLCNKALLPVRVPLTLALTPPVWRFLASRGFKV